MKKMIKEFKGEDKKIQQQKSIVNFIEVIKMISEKSKKIKKPFSDVVDDYLKKVVDKLETREKIRILWSKRLPALGIKQRL